jgi:hypothetical protein
LGGGRRELAMPVPQAGREAAARRLLARTRHIPYRGRCNRRDAAWVGRESSRCTPPPARAGAALHRLHIINGRDSPLLNRNRCGAARVARDSRAALPDRRGREPRRDPLRTRPDQFTQHTRCNGRDAARAGGGFGRTVAAFAIINDPAEWIRRSSTLARQRRWNTTEFAAQIGRRREYFRRGSIRGAWRAARTETCRRRAESTPEMLNLLSDRIHVSRRGPGPQAG